jgi:hypothetical protein
MISHGSAATSATGARAGDHPRWCARTEPPGGDHASSTRHAARADDSLDIRLRLTQPGAETSLALLEVEFVDYDESTTQLLPLHQARRLARAIGRLLE